MAMRWEQFDSLIESELKTDLGEQGDLTTLWTIPDTQTEQVSLMAKESGVLAGLPLFKRIFKIVDPEIICTFQTEDGARVNDQSCIGTLEGNIQSILHGERTALNFLQQLSGIASLTRQYADRIAHTRAKILDTRKTIPGLRGLQKYAVVQGGGYNHRMGLFDMILIKDNHIDACGGIGLAIEKCVDQREKNHFDISIEVETRSLEDVRTVLQYPVERIMLDNMSIAMMTEAVKLIQGKVETEASGNVNLDTVKSIAETGVDYISVGALTHSPSALDISLRFPM